MWSFNIIAFLVYPYLMLTLFVVGHSYRYLADPFRWNSKSSELLDKGSLRIGILIFHWGIIFTFSGIFQTIDAPLIISISIRQGRNSYILSGSINRHVGRFYAAEIRRAPGNPCGSGDPLALGT
jgi:hypothetical protein